MNAPSTSTNRNPLAGLGQDQDALQRAAASAISGVRSTGTDEFEFDFSFPTSPSSSSSSVQSFYGPPATKSEQKRKIRVCVKSAVPLNLDLGAALGGLKRDHGLPSFGTTLPSPVKFQPDDDLDAPATTEPGLRKRKRVMVEIKPRVSAVARPNVRRKLSGADEEEEERWDVSVTEQQTLGDDDDRIDDADNDVPMGS